MCNACRDQVAWRRLKATDFRVVQGAHNVVALTALIELTSRRRSRMNVEMSMSSLPEIDRFLRGFAERSGWNWAAADRLRSASEETLAAS